jgi:hypothetical protein
MKYKRKPIQIEAEPYQEGLEDGFLIKFQNKNHPDRLQNFPNSIEEQPVKIPYIKTRYGGNRRLKIGDWIIISKDGSKDVWDNNKFLKNWEPVKEEITDDEKIILTSLYEDDLTFSKAALRLGISVNEVKVKYRAFNWIPSTKYMREIHKIREDTAKHIRETWDK